MVSDPELGALKGSKYLIFRIFLTAASDQAKHKIEWPRSHVLDLRGLTRSGLLTISGGMQPLRYRPVPHAASSNSSSNSRGMPPPRSLPTCLIRFRV